MIPCSTPMHDDDGRGHRGDDELVPAQPPDLAHVRRCRRASGRSRRRPPTSTAFGRYCSGFVRNSSTIATTTAVVSCATCVWLFASSTISVFVGLPLTRNVLLKPGGDVREAEPDEVVVLDELLRVLDRVGPATSPRSARGSRGTSTPRRRAAWARRPSRHPPGSRCAAVRSAPSRESETPWAERSKIQLTAIAPTTATSPPGIAFTQRAKPIRIAMTAADTRVVCHDA